MNFNQFTQAAAEIAREAGDYIYSCASGTFEIHTKGSSFDFVTSVDLKSQELIRKRLSERFPGDSFLGEEDGLSDGQIRERLEHMGENERCWVVDPLDGTANFIRKSGYYAVSIAMVEKGKSMSGAVYIPQSGELFLAQRGAGAWLNSRRLNVSGCDSLSDALTTTGIPPADFKKRREISGWLPSVSMKTLNLRIIGCAACAISYVAAGRFEAYWENAPHPWDIAAGVLLVEEAGGKVTTLEGEKYRLWDSRILATNQNLHAAMCDLLKGG